MIALLFHTCTCTGTHASMHQQQAGVLMGPRPTTDRTFSKENLARRRVASDGQLQAAVAALVGNAHGPRRPKMVEHDQLEGVLAAEVDRTLVLATRFGRQMQVDFGPEDTLIMCYVPS